MKFIRILQYLWHTMRFTYCSAIAKDCLDQELKASIMAKAEHHKLEANLCRAKLQNLVC
ncbi:hypothetical protein [Sutcliffiella deserti]|uniref:hypothetical protein n=1 Tax=Sutcliffiella deserti TaxID=2875501 RepID=UPI001CC16D1E|nr:hypothetical protein [Sutcliffiella deserti]